MWILKILKLGTFKICLLLIYERHMYRLNSGLPRMYI